MEKSSTNNKFPDFNLLEDEIQQQDYKSKINTLVNDEEKKFSYFSPIGGNFDFSLRKMYWSSSLEIFSRSLIMFTEIAVVVLMYLFLDLFVFRIIGVYFNLSSVIFLNMTLKQIILCAVLIPSCLLSLLFFLPMMLVRTAGGIYNWAITYIIITIFYFLLMESLCAVLLIVSSIYKAISNLDFSLAVYIFLVVFLLISVLWIMASSFLIVKSDDVKKHISLEV